MVDAVNADLYREIPTIKKFGHAVLKMYPTGSRYICVPAPTDTDNDTLILVNGAEEWDTPLLENGWEECGKEYELGGDFRAFRKGIENLIITEDPDFYDKFVLATKAAKALNLLKKEDRIKLFEVIVPRTTKPKGKFPWRKEDLRLF